MDKWTKHPSYSEIADKTTYLVATENGRVIFISDDPAEADAVAASRENAEKVEKMREAVELLDGHVEAWVTDRLRALLEGEDG